ncbi:class I SAM-dependent methyltransferase [Salimicrobium sp. PL1-032A]|uniref:class I SAM-dependent methyltransferase n=1 Tax=Salimicrobium sp. PL1-032A TaxID=3095364 RepID=UPI003261506A
MTEWDQRFNENEYIYGKDVNEFIKNNYDYIAEGGHIACFAEGEGRNAVFLAKEGHPITAYDQSQVGIDKMKRLAEENSVFVEGHCMDLTKEPVQKDTFDGAVMVFGHVDKEDQQFLMENIRDSVKSGGTILIEVYSEDQIAYKTGGPPETDAMYRPQDILNWFDQDKILHFYYGEADRVEGTKHTGLGHVIQIIAVKESA